MPGIVFIFIFYILYLLLKINFFKTFIEKACVKHVFCENVTTFNSDAWVIPENSNNTLSFTLNNWV